MKKMAEICTVNFFNELGVQIKLDGTFGDSEWAENCGQFIQDYKLQLYNHILLHYNMDAMEIEEYTPNDYAQKYFYPLYGRELIRVYHTLFIDYNPLANTDVTTSESYNDTSSNTRTYDSSYDRTGIDSVVASGEDNHNYETEENTTEDKLTTYDDTANYNPTAKSEQSDKGNSKTEYGKTLTSNYGSGEAHSGTDSDEGAKEYSRDIHRVGNIGITSNQRLLEQELSLRAKNSFIDYLVSFLVSVFSTGTWTD